MVKALFDTSVLISAFVSNHPQHQACIHWLSQVKSEQIQGIIAAHTLAETYSVLTRLPLRPRISPTLAQQLIQENLEKFEGVSLTHEDYKEVISQMVELKLAGGAIYDTLIAKAALKAKVSRLLTLNPAHFTRLGEEIAQLIIVPN